MTINFEQAFGGSQQSCNISLVMSPSAFSVYFTLSFEFSDLYHPPLSSLYFDGLSGLTKVSNLRRFPPSTTEPCEPTAP